MTYHDYYIHKQFLLNHLERPNSHKLEAPGCFQALALVPSMKLASQSIPAYLAGRGRGSTDQHLNLRTGGLHLKNSNH